MCCCNVCELLMGAAVLSPPIQPNNVGSSYLSDLIGIVQVVWCLAKVFVLRILQLKMC